MTKSDDHTTNRQQAAQEVVSMMSRHNGGQAPLRVALIGTFAPRKCGVATFTTDVHDMLRRYFPHIEIDVYALDHADSAVAYPGHVHVIDADRPADYLRAARAINESGAQVVWLQHEYGIFGGQDGVLVTGLVDALAAPLITTFHTVLPTPSPSQKAIVRHLLSRCVRAMVMSHYGRDLLTQLYDMSQDSVVIIEHGAPDRAFGTTQAAKARLGLENRTVLTTFGLLGPGKGLEQAIEALPAILERHPDVVYRILGATHPVLVAQQGEWYREGLIALAEKLGVADHIAWENRFLDTDELLDQLEACDIYITPYPHLGQSTSGTLSYAVALGKAVVSTPYIHARELLADGVGSLLADNAPATIAGAVNALLDDRDALAAMQQRAYDRGRKTIWPHFARAAAGLIRSALSPKAAPVSPRVVPGMSGVWAMSDSTGIYQHAIGIIPDRRHGYCVDDNARALMLMNVSPGVTVAEREHWSAIYAAFVQFAWNPDERRFRNFMRFDRTWCEDAGSEDSNGRSLWALGHTVEHAHNPDLARWAMDLFDQVIAGVDEVTSPRAMAFSALGALAVLRTGRHHQRARDMVIECCETLAHLVDQTRRPDWAWFEAVLSYDNPRLCQVLIEGGIELGQKRWVEVGLETLAWINDCQTGANGVFRPIGSESFSMEGQWAPFDQQPLEAQASIEAAAAAWRATQNPAWIAHAQRSYQWFFGANDRGVVLADVATGRCRDGVTPRGRNENCGAESILAFQLGQASLSALLHEADLKTTSGVALEQAS